MAEHNPLGLHQPIRMQGQHDEGAGAGLFYNRHRYYDPQLGRYVSQDPIGLAGGVNTYQYGNANPTNYKDPVGLATQSDFDLAISLIKDKAPEVFPSNPASITAIPDLSSVFGAPVQGYTDLANNIQINANLYGDCRTPVDEFLITEFLQTVAHELQHAQQSTFEKLLTHGPLHEQLDRNAEIIANQTKDEFKKRRPKSPTISCKCSP
ncbi:RHS repeat-associated core domain-containing protein [Acidovorax sp. NCPPB 4044]|uniref:RHS repeat-associated core domain-containing protein n=1 Tax=Acidovorax sp. NCPPB 4044 TaxID=2940490 RepID=UPI00232054F8|nr:RHS repeat-associated core domain-containing protein [Acidovorax sp. NCPPB 4044]